jgi:uncharacterized protein
MPAIKRVAIIGVTGFIGRGLPELLANRGVAVTGISRSGKGELPNVDRWQTPESLDLSDHDAVINLAGEPIDQRWTEENRRKFHESRVGTTYQIVAALRRLPEHSRPNVLINGSAVGIYGDRSDEILTEKSAAGTGYLADLCREWEDAALDAQDLGLRVVRLRTGIVLGKGGPAFEKLSTVFKTGIGGKLGTGRQWMPWIHVEDLRGAIVHAVFSKSLDSPINGSAPHPERNADFTRKFAAALHRPALFTVPGFALKIALGEFGGTLLESQRALPATLEADGFAFRFPTLEAALENLTR